MPNTSVWERSNALNCIERASLITNFRIGSFLCVSGAAFASHFGLSILIAGMTLLVEVIKLERASPSARPSLTPQVVGFDHFGDIGFETHGQCHSSIVVLDVKCQNVNDI